MFIKVIVGSILLGYVYYLKDECNIYFYCVGINEEIVMNKVKLGYVLYFFVMVYFVV